MESLKDLRNQWVLMLFAFCMPLGFSVMRWVLVIFTLNLAWSIVEKVKMKKFTVQLQTFFYLPIMFFAVHSLSALYSQNSVGPEIEKRLLFVIFPLFVMLIDSNVPDKMKLYKAYIAGVILAMGVCVVNALANSISFNPDGFGFDATVAGGVAFIWSITHGGNYFFSSHLSQVLSHPAFLTIHCTFAVVLIYNLFYQRKAVRGRNWLILLIIVLSIFTFLLSSRIGIIVFFIINMLWVGLLVNKLKISRKRKVSILGAAFFITLVSIYFNPRVEATFEKVQKAWEDGNVAQRILQDRYYTWTSGWEIIKENPLLGVGVGDSYSELHAVFHQRGLDKLVELDYNTHNQFIQTYLATGFLGFILLLGLIFVPLKVSWHKRDYVLMSFVLIILINCLTDTLIERIDGIVFFMFFYGILLQRKEETEGKPI